MLVYKLTDPKGETRNNTKWGPGVTHETSGVGVLCGPGWLHYYHTPELAVLFNPIHADFVRPQLWEAEADGRQLDDFGMKGGCTRLKTTRELDLPPCSREQRAEFAIRCARLFGEFPRWDAWADGWLNGSRRGIFSWREARSELMDAANNRSSAAWQSVVRATEAAFALGGCPSPYPPEKLAAFAARAYAQAGGLVGPIANLVLNPQPPAPKSFVSGANPWN